MIKSNFKFFWSCWETGVENNGNNDGIPLMTVDQRKRLFDLNGYSEIRREETNEDPPVCTWVTQTPSGQGGVTFNFIDWMSSKGYTSFQSVTGTGASETPVIIGQDSFTEIIPALTAISLDALTTDNVSIRNLVTYENPIPEEAWSADPIHFTSVSHIINTYGWSRDVEGYYQLDFEGFPDDIITQSNSATRNYKFLSEVDCPLELKNVFENALAELIHINIFKIKEYFPNLKITNYAWPRIGLYSPDGSRPWGNGSDDYSQVELDWLNDRVQKYKKHCEYFDFLSPFARPFFSNTQNKIRERSAKKASVKLAKMLRDSYGKNNRQLPIYPSTATVYHQSRMMGWGASTNPDIPASGGFPSSPVGNTDNIFHEGEFVWQRFNGNIELPISSSMVENDGTDYFKANFTDEILQPMLDEGADGIWLYSQWGFPGLTIIYPSTSQGNIVNLYRMYMVINSFSLHKKFDVPYFKYVADEFAATYPDYIVDGHPIGWNLFRANTNTQPLTPLELKLKNYFYNTDSLVIQGRKEKLYETFRNKMFGFASQTRSVSLKHKIKNIARKNTIQQLTEIVLSKKKITDTSSGPPIAV